MTSLIDSHVLVNAEKAGNTLIHYDFYAIVIDVLDNGNVIVEDQDGDCFEVSREALTQE